MNLRPPGYEPDELPDCSTPRRVTHIVPLICKMVKIDLYKAALYIYNSTMLNNLHKHLQETDLLPAGSKILLAVSGGVDSVSLLHLLHNLRDVYGWDISIAHYNHGARADAYKDALLVGDLANEYGYPFYLGKYEYTDFSEAALRKARYDFLESIRRDIGYDYIVTAHHNNDLLETAVFNTIRGADREGMVSLKPRRGNVIRPMLTFSKPEIIVFANLQKLPYREDSTNSDLGYSRNFVRNVLMPQGSVQFRQFHHNMNKRLSRLNELNSKINLGLSRLAGTLVDFEDNKSLQVDTDAFNQLSDTIKPSLLVYLIKRIKPVHGLSKANISKAIKFVQNPATGAKLNLPGGLQLVNTYDKFVITSEPGLFAPDSSDALHFLSPAKPFKNELFHLSISPEINTGVRVPAQKLFVRYRQAGDRVKPMGMNGSKKLQDVFVDAKVPRHMRPLWPVVVNSSNEIVWVPQLVKDRRFFEASADNYQYLICEVI